uniref:Aminotransferase n=1 Tax=Thermosporothrix sp. COM3 TaxID=2490863 RepID=A0A455SF25_9CHLR|nr:aminotransferase [Thermosporothrix sp. COM3]
MHEKPLMHTVMHGALDFAELERLGLHPDAVLDCSVNSNPYGPSPRVREALRSLIPERYPDRDCLALKRALLATDLADVPLVPEMLVCGNGASELIWALARTFLYPGAKVALFPPTFGEYKAASEAVDATILTFPACEEAAFQLDVEAACTWLERQCPALVWLCNPNNPTGALLTGEQLFRLAQSCTACNALLVIDESYYRFVVPEATSAALPLLAGPLAEHVVVLRSMTKDYALAALRLGYAVLPPERARQLQSYLPSWNVNGAAQLAGVAALADRDHLRMTMSALAIEREHFFRALARWPMIPSHTHYCLLDVGSAVEVRQCLLRKALLVRDCTSFGLPRYIRVATRRRDEWPRLVAALQEII